MNQELNGYGHPNVMTIGKSDANDMHKVWSNMRSPGKGARVKKIRDGSIFMKRKGGLRLFSVKIRGAKTFFWQSLS